MEKRTDLGTPKFSNAVLLKCLYCGKTPLLRKGSWFDFDKGCSSCDYRYEREIGYYTGSSWIINYVIISAVGIIVAAYCAFATSIGGLGIASIASAAMVAFGIFWFPFGSSLWMYFDHVFHPLHMDDRLSATPDGRPH